MSSAKQMSPVKKHSALNQELELKLPLTILSNVAGTQASARGSEAGGRDSPRQGQEKG